MKILNLDNWCEEATEIVKKVAEVHTKVENFTQYDGLITNLNPIDLRYHELAGVKFVASCTTGLDHINLNGPFEHVKIISLKGETDFLKDVHATSEMTWALIMALIRKVPFAHNHVIEGGWDRERFQGVELRNKTLGIVGYGRVGQQVAKFAKAFGMNVIPYDKCDKWDNVGPFLLTSKLITLEKVLRESDIITVHVPLDSETKGMFSYEQFKLIKPTAYFINTSRGAIVDEEALIWALENKIIAGATLDVVQNEPKPWARLLHYASKHDNLLLTCHIAGNTQESRRKTQIHIANRIVEYIKNTKGV